MESKSNFVFRLCKYISFCKDVFSACVVITSSSTAETMTNKCCNSGMSFCHAKNFRLFGSFLNLILDCDVNWFTEDSPFTAFSASC